MLKSQLEPTSTTARNYEPATTMFVENIFDTVKKAKAAKAAAKSLADSKLISSYQYSFADMSPLKKKKKRKNTKANGKMKKTATPKKKASPRKHKIVNKKVGEQQKKSTPPKSPRKYTKRAAKIPVANDIDDEEAAFILSSISQRSFDSFYSRLNSCGSTNKITIPLEVSSSGKSFSSSSDPVQNLAYYVMLDHNYWIQPEVPAEPEIQVIQEIQVDQEVPAEQTVPVVKEIPAEKQILAEQDVVAAVIEAPTIPEILAEVIPERIPIDVSVEQHKEDKYFKVEVTTPIDIKPISECNTICRSNEMYKTDEIEENNNKRVTPDKDISQIVACQKKDTTAVKKRWLRRAATEMKTSPKKKKKLEFDEINNDNEVEKNYFESTQNDLDKVVEAKVNVAIKPKEEEIKVELNESLEEVFESKVCECLVAKVEHEVKEESKLVPIEDVSLELVEDKKVETSEMKPAEPAIEMKAEEVKIEDEMCNEHHEDRILSPLKETKVEELDEKDVTEDEEIDEKSWDLVMDFHQKQLNKLTNANLRHSKSLNITSLDHNSVDRTYTFQKARSLSLTPKSCDNEYVSKADINYSRLPSFPGCPMLNLAQHADSSRNSHERDKHEPYFHKSSPFAPQRSLSKTFLNNHSRARRFENGLTIPYNSSSFESPSPFYGGEPFYQKDDISSRTSYSTYRAQKAFLKELVDPAWEKQFGRPLDEFTTQRSLIMKKCDETPLIGISRVLSKPTLSTTILPKARTSVSDPRLNPSLVNDTRKDEATIPKKKLSLDQYRKRVSLTSIGDSPSIEEPSISTSPAFDPVISEAVAEAGAAEASTG